jgi:hypothetical protein
VTTRPPDDPAALAGFPAKTVAADYRYLRIHHDRFEAEWFCDCGGCRFDLSTDTGLGTCYLAGHPLGAYAEKFGRFNVLPRSLVDQHSMARLALPSPVRVADMTDRTVVGRWQLSASIWAGDDYRVSQLWAMRLQQAGFAGIWYSAAHDVVGAFHSLALFGKSGHRPDSLLRYEDEPISQDLIDEGYDTFAIHVLPSGL